MTKGSERVALTVEVSQDPDPEIILLSAINHLFCFHPATSCNDSNAKARVARYINERFGVLTWEEDTPMEVWKPGKIGQ